ncbi:MAG: exodeoxyribonuclease VII small subunit [Chromatiales bacterium]|nr:exodeoxyribonuclease VII small subunit [Chromatiales bacterium]
MGTKKAASEPSFENALNELEKLVERLESGETTLEESLQLFERGVELSRVCQTTLEAAEQRVRILTEKNETAKPQDLDPGNG